jgi:heat shock protein HtpX
MERSGRDSVIPAAPVGCAGEPEVIERMGPVYAQHQTIRANRARMILLTFLFFLSIYAFVFVLMYLWIGMFSTRDALSVKEGCSELSRLCSLSAYETLSVAVGAFVARLPYITAGIALWIVGGFLLHKQVMNRVSGRRLIGPDEFPEIQDMLHRLSPGTPPRLAIIDTERVNAFASGLFRGQETITLTTGLIHTLSCDEIETVLAHEITHLENRDTVVMTVYSMIVGSFVMIFEFAGFMLWRRHQGVGEWFDRVVFLCQILGLLLIAIAVVALGDPLFAIVLASLALTNILMGRTELAAVAAIPFLLVSGIGRLITALPGVALSRTREYLADAGAVELTRNPQALISALIKASGRNEPIGSPDDMLRICLDHPRRTLSDMFSSHPDIPERISAIIDYAGDRFDLTGVRESGEE